MVYLKRIIKLFIPSFVFLWKANLNYRITFWKTYYYDLQRYLEYADGNHKVSKNILLGSIIRRYHSLEKGLTMPEMKLGFGIDVAKRLITDCILFISEFGKEDEQLRHAIAVVQEYKLYHEAQGFKLDNSILSLISSLQDQIAEEVSPSHQRLISKAEYFRESESSFLKFSNSRLSVRHYSDIVIPENLIIDAIELSTNAPSACNRQAWRTYLYVNRDQIQQILKVQGGNRGFGHLADKLVIITSEVGVFTGISERNQAFIDGGIFAMNLLYALHYKRIAACILNCSATPEKDLKLRELTGIKNSEVFIAMISCGNVPEQFKVPLSKRYSVSNIVHVVK